MDKHFPIARRTTINSTNDLTEALCRKVVGQPKAIAGIVPYIQMHQASLAPEGRPAGVFLLLGPTGTGKTRTVEALAEQLHGSSKQMLKVDCGEFQMEHEVAKLIGAPPGYLGHRETQPMFTQAKVNAVSSERCDLSIVLFDEIEKAAHSMTRLLLGILDKAALRLGDNTTVNFERTLIFLTSNLGARAMFRAIRPDFGFESIAGVPHKDQGSKLESIGVAAVRRRFTPEFVNRIDQVITYHPLDADAMTKILDHLLADFQRLVNSRLGARAFRLELTARARKFLLKEGTSEEFGARELKRTLHRFLVHPLAAEISASRIAPGSLVRADARNGHVTLRVFDDEERAA